jgi:hypothetical protein
MGILQREISWLAEHSVTGRMSRVQYDFLSGGISSGTSSLVHETYGFITDALFIGGIVATRGGSILAIPTGVAVATGSGFFYSPDTIDPTSYGPAGWLYQHQSNKKVTRKSIGSTRRSGGPVQARTSGGNRKPSRPTRSGQTSKPFWSNGKPKCKKGFRYDFKRKLCVKIK